MDTEQYFGCSVFFLARNLPEPGRYFSFSRRTLNDQDPGRFNGCDKNFAVQ